MRKHLVFAAAMACLIFPACAQTNHYVSLSGGNNPPYTNWAMAATTIQAAIDASGMDDVIWVTNGIYQTGGATNYPTGSGLTNRVAIHKPVTVRSVNGPSNTVIKGAWNPGTTNGPAAVRCVYMTNGATLIGFTVTNGATLAAGDQYAGGIRAASTTAIISNCVITFNRSNDHGGGVYQGTLYNCDISFNVAQGGSYYGGGAWAANLYNCRVFNNSAIGPLFYGGGIYGCRAHECLIVSNYARTGGGARASTLYNCRLFGNTAVAEGGGADYSWLYNCLVEGNTAASAGGGVWNQGTFTTNYNCTIIGNRSGNIVGGAGANSANGTVLFNCIVRDNSPDNYHANTTLRYCNSSPLPAGEGNINTNPMFVAAGSGVGTTRVFGDSRLVLGSPCVNAGTNFPWQASDPLGYGRDKDLDGQPRLRGPAVDMGAYEQYIAPGTIFIIRGQ